MKIVVCVIKWLSLTAKFHFVCRVSGSNGDPIVGHFVGEREPDRRWPAHQEPAPVRDRVGTDPRSNRSSTLQLNDSTR